MSKRTSPPAAALADEIAEFCARTGMSPTAFGKKVMRDPSFVPALSQGRDVRLTTVERVRAFIASNEKDEDGAAA